MAPSKAVAIREIPAVIAGWLGLAPGALGVRDEPGVDLLLDAGAHRFAFRWSGRDDVATLERAGAALDGAGLPPGTLRIVVLPHAGAGAREWLRARGRSWLDLAGNADITGPGLLVHVEGKPKRFSSAGRPSTAFSPRAARISRLMLLDPSRAWSQAELVLASRLSRGFVSKVVGRMVSDGLLVRDSSRVFPSNPALLLDSWAQRYRFQEHSLGRFHLAARTGPSTLQALGRTFDEAGLDWAATGLAAAWSLTRFADFRLTSIYLRGPLADPAAHGLHAVDRGENVWLLLPRDDGVFDGVQIVGGARCASIAQVYLDLGAHPERSKEAAAHLRAKVLGGSAP